MTAATLRDDAKSQTQWISEGQKYAIIGLGIKLDTAIGLQEMAPGLWGFDNAAFKMPANWREWLGSMRASEVERSNLFLLSKLDSKTPGILDGENEALKLRVWHFYTGLLLSSRFASAHSPVLLTGTKIDGEIRVRQQQDLDAIIPCAFRGFPEVSASVLNQAASLAENIGNIGTSKLQGGHWRFFRILSLYIQTRSIADNIDRAHQYCRCIEGLLVPKPGDSAKRFKSRTELFIGPKHHDFMGQAYEMRGAVEHLHEDKYLDPFDRNVRLDVLVKEAVVEYIAREALQRIIRTPALWHHFANTTALENFWNLDETERQKLWGLPIDPMEALTEYDPKYISNAQLGA